MTNLVGLVACGFLLVFVAVAHGDPAADRDATTKFLDNLFKNYDKRLRPHFGKDPIPIEVSAYVLDVFDIDETKHEFSVNMYLRHHWNDDRLLYTPPVAGMESVFLDTDHANELWTPDTFIVNERRLVHHGVKSLQELTRIEPDGDVLQSYRITATASCKMNLGYFPFDRQRCSMEIESYGHTTKEFYYAWRAKIGVSQSASSLKFKVTGVNTVQQYVTVGSGNYSRLALEFFFVRNSARHLLDIYFPVFAMTVVAFFTLFSGSLITRVQLSVATLLVLSVFMRLNSTGMPTVSYMTAMDHFIFFCAAMILHVVVVNFLMYNFHKPNEVKGQDRLTRLNEEHENQNGRLLETLYDGSHSVAPELNTKFDEILYGICTKSKLTLPLCFVAYNLIYWIVVLAGSSWFPEDFTIVETRE